MTIQASLAVLFWVLAFTAAMTVRRDHFGLATGMILGWLFLPNFNVSISGLPDFGKQTIVVLLTAALAGLIRRDEPSGARLRWYDIPAIALPIFCAVSSVVRGLGIYDGLSAAFGNLCFWTIPYLIGRFVFSSRQSATALLKALVICACIYVPFCVWEMKMSPRLHSIVYGMGPRGSQNYFRQAIRYGMWRPTVFFEHGLALAIFMAIAAATARFAAITGALPRISATSTSAIALVLGVTTFFTFSTGAIALLAIIWVAAATIRTWTGRIALGVLSLIPVVYPLSRISGDTTIVDVVVWASESAADVTDEAKAGSFQFRVNAEDRLLDVWSTSKAFGNAAKFRAVEDGDAVVVDSFWIVMLGKYGLCGWACWTAMLAVPGLIVSWQLCIRRAATDQVALCLVTGAMLFNADNMVNGMDNPLCVALAGASIALLMRAPERTSPPQADRPSNKPVSLQRRMWPVVADLTQR